MLPLDQFLAASERRAYRICLLATGEQADALDIVQDAMLKLVKHYARRAPEEWPALFHRIVQNTIKDWYRKEKVRRRWRSWFSIHDDEGEKEDGLEQQAQQGTHQPDELTGQSIAMAHLDDQIRQLPLRQQQTFLLRQWEGLDVAATAKAMGISEGSVKTHYSRAVHKLRETLEEHV
ncbi:RNA polymerase sigma-70 factor [hydrothermal vent metagenome]|uniref:RNA polymerase sigma-70 factor n=1 Tax=hydrothermal vent metagenome TaxID=652676 RepID=A0A3B1AL47_9ZZZZ